MPGAVGVHPHHAHLFAANPDRRRGWWSAGSPALPAARAIGEIGLDYHYDFSPREVQHAVFRAQLRLARERDLPIVIHTREAEDDTLRILREGAASRLRGVFHCFTGDTAAADRALATGFFLSIPGVVTFPKAGDAARRPWPRCRSTGCWSRPTAPTWRRCRIAASATSRPMSRRCVERGRRSPRHRRGRASAADPISAQLRPPVSAVSGRKALRFKALTRSRALTPRGRRMVRSDDVSNAAPRTQADLIQLFEPVRERSGSGRARVRAAGPVADPRHPGDRQLPAEERRQARAPGGAADERAAVRLHRPARRAERRGGRVHPHRHAGPRRHHRRCRRAARTEGGALAVGQRRHGARRRLPLHQVDGDGAHAGHARHRPHAVRRHAADDRRRDLPADQERRRRSHRRTSTSRSSAARRRYLFGGCAQIGGMLGEVERREGAGASRVRLQPRHHVPAGRRPAGLHRRGRSARQADRRRPARRQDHAADHSPAAAGRPGGRAT